MFKVMIDGKEHEAKVSFYTAQLYEAEFRADIIKDLFGNQEIKDPVVIEGGAVVSIDFTAVNWLAMTKVLWAALKTADESTPGYQAWMKDTSGVNFWEVREQLDSEFADCFFRSEAAGEDEQE